MFAKVRARLEQNQWDLIVRVCHWGIAAAVLANYWILEEGDAPHEWVGYVMLALIVCRVIWGFIGTSPAQFKSFFPTPARLKHYLSQAPSSFNREHPSHNPLGGLMAIFLWTTLLVCGVSGWMQEFDMFWGEDWVENLHSTAADVAIVAAAIHVLAVFSMQKYSGVPLVKAMVFGRR